MPQQGITFQGQYIGLPGAYYADILAPGTPNPLVTPPLVLIGYGWGPKPKSITTYTSTADLIAAVRGGPVADFINFIANPSPALNGCGYVTFIDASENTQSALALMSTGGVYATLTSVSYGPPSNQLQAQVANGTLDGIRLTLTDNYAGTQIVGDNLGFPFEVAYTGTATGAVSYNVTLPGAGVSSGTFQLTSPIAGESFTIPIGSGGYSTVSQLVEYIDGTTQYAANILSSTNGELPSNFLNSGGTSLPVSGSGAVTYVAIDASVQEPVWWINQFGSAMAVAVTGVGATGGLLPVNSPPTFFSGARGVPPINSDYASALNLALTTPAWAVFCDSGLPAVQALLTQHVETASTSPYGMWRRGFTGSSLGDSVATTITNSRALDASGMMYLYPGISRRNTNTGQVQLYDGLHVAAAAAGIACGNNVNIPLTMKALNAIGVEQISGSALTGSQLAQLQNNGVACVFTPTQTNVPTIMSDITTWEVDNNAENTSSQQVACRYWLAYSVVNALFPYVGTIASPQTETSITTALIAVLNSLIFTGAGSNGVLASWKKGSVALTFNGQQQLASCVFEATLVSQNRYIVCTATIDPLAFTITTS